MNIIKFKKGEDIWVDIGYSLKEEIIKKVLSEHLIGRDLVCDYRGYGHTQIRIRETFTIEYMSEIVNHKIETSNGDLYPMKPLVNIEKDLTGNYLKLSDDSTINVSGLRFVPVHEFNINKISKEEINE